MHWQRLVYVASWWMMLSMLLQNQAQAQPPIPGAAGNVGEQYFQQYCSACHGIDGRGNGPVATALKTPPADLTRIAQRRGGQFPEAEIASIIDGRTSVGAHGSRDMPVWGQKFGEKFGGGAIGDEAVRGHLLVLIKYLQSIQH